MSRSLQLGTRSMWLIGAAAANLLLVACGGGGSGYGSGVNNPPPPASANVQLASKAALGSYLVDGNGRTLYYFGLDLPGTSAQAPVSNCAAAGGCIGLWPIFHADNLSVGTGLNASDFGELDRQDGAKQTTYKGWPLYYYAGDSRQGDTNGDNFETWYVLRDPFYALLVMEKTATSPSYLADAQGRAVYTNANDVVGSGAADPVSACTGACLNTWSIFVASGTAIPTGVNGQITTFTRPDGMQQSALGGHPLYYFSGDSAPGQTNGQGLQGVWATGNPSL